MKIRAEAWRYVNETGMACGWSKETGTYALARVLNALAAEDADCMGVEAQILIPPQADTTKAYAMETCIRRICRARGIEQKGTRITKNPLYRVPVVMVNGIGRAPEGNRPAPEGNGVAVTASGIGGTPEGNRPAPEGNGIAVTASGIGVAPESNRPAQAGTDRDPEAHGAVRSGADPGSGQGDRQITGEEEIVLVKWIGMEGMLRIAEERESELEQRFAPVFMRQIKSYKEEIFAGVELKIARAAGAAAVRQITEGGIFAALWELAKETGAGFEADMKRMTVLQETIEVCEHFRLNPYQLTSTGSFLVLIQNGDYLADILHKNQIEASVIGRLTKGNGKIVRNGEDMRCLDRPSPDEIYKIF